MYKKIALLLFLASVTALTGCSNPYEEPEIISLEIADKYSAYNVNIISLIA